MIAGGVLALLPKITADWPETGLAGVLSFLIGCLMIPGYAVGVVAAGFTIHDISQWVVDSADFVFYSGLSYAVLLLLTKREGSDKAA